MKPIKFPGHNVVFAEDQPQYQPLPAYREPDGTVTTCWELTPDEMDMVLQTGTVYVKQLTFNQPLQPLIVFAFSLPVPNESTHTEHPQQEQSPQSTED
jgi:hypothetical protein